MAAESARGTPVPRFARRFWPVWLAALAGVASLLLQPVAHSVLEAGMQAGASARAMRFLLLVNPLVLATLMALAGAALAHRLGLGSHLAGTRHGPLAWRAALGAGLAVGILLMAADLAVAPALGAQWQEFLQRQAGAPLWPGLPVGMLYGGLAEEVMLRWGALTLLAALLARVTGRWRLLPQAGLPSWIAWTAIVLASALFAAGHLPVLAQLAEPSPALVLRTLGLNFAAGLLYGWLFWRRSLEAAMAAHAATHVGMTAVRLVLA